MQEIICTCFHFVNINNEYLGDKIEISETNCILDKNIVDYLAMVLIKYISMPYTGHILFLKNVFVIIRYTYPKINYEAPLPYVFILFMKYEYKINKIQRYCTITHGQPP